MTYKTKSIQEAVNAILAFMEAQAEAKKELETIREKYAGELLAEKEAAVIEPATELLEKAKTALHDSYAELQERTDVYNSIRGTLALCSDYGYFNLPVKLEEKHLRELGEKNKANHLFIAALNQYATNCGYDNFVCNSRYTELQNTLNEYKRATSSIFSGEFPLDVSVEFDVLELTDREFAW